jgi:hypothetical protein
MVLAPASASHTYKSGKYKCKISNKQYKKLRYADSEKYVKAKNTGKKKFTLKIYSKSGKYLGKKKCKVKASVYTSGWGDYGVMWYCKEGIIKEKALSHL